jgi:hypothetical protein
VETSFFDTSLFFFLFVGFISLGVIVGTLFLLRAIARTKSRADKAFNRVVLQVLVPKERKSEGSGGQAGTEDRLEQVKEEIGMTETFFASIAGLRAQKGLGAWFSGRNDHISLEIVSHNNLIYFYIDIPKKYKSFIEQQLHAQHPHAEIEEMTDYNIFSEESTIVGAYLVGQQKKPVFPFKTYKSMESDPLSAILNVLAKFHEQNSSLAIQFVVRSAPKKWRTAGAVMVRDIKKGEKFEDVAKRSALGKAFGKTTKEVGELIKSPEQQARDTKEGYTLSAMEEEMLKGIEQKLSKGGMDVTIRLLSVSDNPEFARMHLDELVNAFGQYNLYRYGNSFGAAIPRKQPRLIRDFIYRSFDDRRKLLLTTEEMASLWHLPLHSTEAPNIKWLSGRKAPPPSELPAEGLHLGFINYRGSKTEVYMKESDRRRHLYIIGKSGSGKSVLISNLAIQDIQNGHGVGIVDPHGDIFQKNALTMSLSLIHRISIARSGSTCLRQKAKTKKILPSKK